MGFAVSDARKRRAFKSNQSAEAEFAAKLEKVAKEAAKIVNRHADGAEILTPKKMLEDLTRYAEKIGPWAAKVSSQMLQKAQRKSKKAWEIQSTEVHTLLNRSVGAETNVGKAALGLLNEQVSLIKSLPIEAGLRAQRIAYEHFLNGTRANPDEGMIKQLQQEMGATYEVAKNRAKLIARTETTRANTAFTQARAISIGSVEYIWRCSFNPNSRHSHEKMDGKVCRWDRPPRLSDGTVGHPGTFPNCMCYPEPVLPDEY